MKKLYLTSVKIGGITRLWTKAPETARVIFIPTAADPHEDKSFIESDKKQWQDLGFGLQELDLKGQTELTLHKHLSNADIVYVAGGNTFYLLEKVLQSGFDVVIKDLISKGVIYAGGSAGAVLVGPTIEPVKVFDNEKDAALLKTYQGLSLVDFIVLPHYGGDQKHDLEHQKVMKEWSKNGYTLIPITNDQAIIVEGEKWKVTNV